MRIGCKAAPHDAAASATLPHVTFLETVLFGPDMHALEATAAAFCNQTVRIVHAPFTLAGGQEVDVADPDPDVRAASYEAWEQSMELADRLDATWVVLHPGGIAPHDLPDDEQGIRRADALEHAERALERLASEHGRDRILIENMPDHFHRADGTTHQSLIGRSALDLVAWRDLVGGYCLDTSHACLTAGGTKTLDTMIARLGTDIRHLHLSDANPPHGEGTPIGTGIIPWDDLVPRLHRLDARIDGLSAVPEIKDGHKHDAAGFRTALERLHDWFPTA